MTDKITEAFAAGRECGHFDMIAKTNDQVREQRYWVDHWKAKGGGRRQWGALDDAASILECHAELLQSLSREIMANAQDARSAPEGTPGGSEAESAAGGPFAGDFRE